MHPIVVITSSSPDPKIAFISRVFAPLSGVEEDPVTGSAHCLLGPYWARKQNSAIGVEVSAKQVSARGGEVGVVWDQEKGVCKLRGFAKVIARGEIYVPHPS